MDGLVASSVRCCLCAFVSKPFIGLTSKFVNVYVLFGFAEYHMFSVC